MKNKIKSIFLILSFFSLLARSQSSSTGKGSLTGHVVDEKQQPLPYVNVVVLDSARKLLEGTITEENGKFTIEKLPLGHLIIEMSNFGYMPYSKDFSLNKENNSLDLGDISLTPNLTLLNEVEVSSEKSMLLLKKDKKVFNVGKDVLAHSHSALDILENIPSVSVNANGQVSLRGNSNVTVLINGKRSGLTLNNALEQVPAVNIDRIEVITNPSSNYDASGSAGILNIILKKNTDNGLNGQVTARVGIPTDYRISPSLTYKNNKINIFTTLGILYTDYVGRYQSTQVSRQLGLSRSLNQDERENRHDDGQLFYGGLDYYFTDKTSITAAYNINKTKDSDVSRIDYNYSKEGNLDSALSRRGTSIENRSYNQIEFNFTHNFDKKDKKYTVDFQYDFWNSNKDWDIQTTRIFPTISDPSKLRTNNKNGNKDFVLQTDFSLPIKEKSKFETGLKGEYRNVYNYYLAEHFVTDSWLIFNGLDNQLDYNEMIGAAYAQYGSEMGNFNYLLGVRNEFTEVRIKDHKGVFNKNIQYNNLFPTVNLGYKLSEKSDLQLNYSRRITRPSIWILSPFNEIKDFTFQFAGNPDLNPSYTNAFELSVNSNLSKVTLNSSVYYHQTTNFFQDYLFQDSTGSFITKPINLPLEDRYGIDASINYNPIQRLKLFLNFNLYGFKQQGTYGEQNFDYSNKFWEMQARSQIKFPKEINFQAFLGYVGKNKNAQTITKPLYYLNLSLNKSFFSNKLTIALNASNVFNSRAERTLTVNPNYTFERSANRNAQRYNISIIYRLTKNQFNERRIKESNRN